MSTILNVIDIPEEDIFEEGDTKTQMGFFARIWFSLSRSVRRAISRGGRAMNKMLNKLPPKLRAALSFGALLVGWFAAWIFFYAAIIIAFSYSILGGFAVIFVFGTLLYYAIAWYDNH